MLSYKGPKEIFVIDDCSTETSNGRRLEEIERVFPIVNVIRHKKNKGLSATRNTGLDLCSGEYIQFLDADDLLFPGKVDSQISHLTLGNELDVSVNEFMLCDETLSEFNIIEPSIGTYEFTLDDFLYKWERGFSIPIHSALFKREVFSEIRFDESLTAKEDWLFWCTQSIKKKRIAFLDLYGALYRQHKTAMTKNRISEMGRMWIKSSLLIDNLLGSNDNTFLSSALSWYHIHYEKIPPQLSQVETGSLTNPDHAEKNISTPLNLDLKPNNKLSTVEKKYFSFVIPVYDHYDYLSRCFKSICDQTFADYEIICVDDNSSDVRVKEFLNSLARDFPIIKVIFNENNFGISTTINRGIEEAQGDFIVFLDCDDYISSNALAEVVMYLRKQPNIDYLFSDKIDVDENDQFIRKAVYGGYPNIHRSNDIKNDLLDGMVASHLKVIRKSKIIEVGGCDPMLEGVQDYDLALRIAETGKFKYINKPLYYHRQHTNSVTKADTISQFRKENVARRKICDRWYTKNEDPRNITNSMLEQITENHPITSAYLENTKVILFTPKNYSLPQIKFQVRSGCICIFDARGEPLSDWAYFLREYNSYFDLILTSDPKVFMFLIGYLWDYQIIKLIPEDS
jgi:glycosyltransferase involved in cell wall biosynthesis